MCVVREFKTNLLPVKNQHVCFVPGARDNDRPTIRQDDDYHLE